MNRRHAFCSKLLLLVAFLATAGASNAQTVTQTFDLMPGWNAIYLAVEPVDEEPTVVFGPAAFSGPGFESAWTFAEPLSAATFTQDPDAEPFNIEAWLPLLEPSDPASFATNLFAVQGHRAYMIRIDPDAVGPVTLTVVGRPSYEPLSWKPDGFTLTGLPIDPAAAPTLGGFFVGSPAHAQGSFFRLQSDGTWTPATGLARAGEAYWIFTEGSSDYQGPLELELAGDGTLDFGEGLGTRTLVLRSRTGSSVSASMRLDPVGAGAGVPLARQVIDQGIGFEDLQANEVLDVPTGPGLFLTLGVRRAMLPRDGTASESLLTITDGAGTRYRLPVRAARERIATASGPGAPGMAGLWVGSATLSRVSQSQAPAEDLSFDLQLSAVTVDGEESLLDSGRLWCYRDPTLALPAGWQTEPCDDTSPLGAGWLRSSAALGFGDGGVDTPGLVPGAASYHFVRTIETAPPAGAQSFLLRLRRDDGAIVYLDGVEIARSNLSGASDPVPDTPLDEVRSGDESSFVQIDLAGTLPVAAGSELAVAVYQYPRAPGPLNAVTETPAEFPLRLILHVDEVGQVRLLKQVIQMWQNGVEAPSTSDPSLLETVVPGRFVLVTDDTQIPLYSGAALRDGRPVGFRLSSPAFDFAGDAVDLSASGAFGESGQTLGGQIVVSPDLPTHPFRHRYHPDHGAEGESRPEYEPGSRRVPEITRDLNLAFAADDPTAPPGDGNPLQWGETIVGGTYTETLSGLHREDIIVEGPFQLRRISTTAELNQ